MRMRVEDLQAAHEKNHQSERVDPVRQSRDAIVPIH
jgi:hypothetical protein